MSDSLVVELRSAQVSEVRFPERIITVLAVPYEKVNIGPIAYRGRIYEEMFVRHAFRGVESRNGRVMVNREHQKGKTVGKVAQFNDSHEGLFADLKIVNSPVGDEVLALADDEMIFPSVGFAVKNGSDQELNHRTDPPRRTVKRAFIDHMGMVEDPAYASGVLSVRSAAEQAQDAGALPRINTPRLDEWLGYLESRRVGMSA